MSDIRYNGWLHTTGTGGVYQDSAGNVGIASTQPQTSLDIGNGVFQVGPAGIVTTTQDITARTFIPSQGQTSHKNLVINGDMRVAQRGTSFTANGYCLDRYYRTYSSGTAAVTQEALTSGAPFDAGFRYTMRHTQPGSAMADAAGAYVNPQMHLEAQDIATSGWNYKDPNSYLTLSYWAKSSVAQTFYNYMLTSDGTSQGFSWSLGALSANTWKKVEVQVPGNSNITIDNNNGNGMTLYFNLYLGTDRTDAGNTLNAWANWNGASRTPVQTNTWFTTAGATFDITGVQLEVGQAATPFEHRSHSDELARCQRYFFNIKGDQYDAAGILGYALDSEEIRVKVEFPVPMRQMPTYTGNAKDCKFKANNTSSNMHWSNLSILNSQTTPNPKSTMMKFDKGSSLSVTAGECGDMEFHEDGGELQFSAEF